MAFAPDHQVGELFPVHMGLLFTVVKCVCECVLNSCHPISFILHRRHFLPNGYCTQSVYLCNPQWYYPKIPPPPGSVLPADPPIPPSLTNPCHMRPCSVTQWTNLHQSESLGRAFPSHTSQFASARDTQGLGFPIL